MIDKKMSSIYYDNLRDKFINIVAKNYFHLHLTVIEIFAKRFYGNKKRGTDLQKVFDAPSLKCAILSFQARQHNSLL